MKAKIAFQKLEDVDRKEWIQLTENAVRPYYINQEYEYAKIMESGGISPIYFLSIRDPTGKIGSGIVFYSTKTRLGEILTSGGGPIVIDDSPSLLEEGLQRFVKEYKHKFLNIRIAFLPPSNLLNGRTILKAVRPAMTSIVDLTPPIEEILRKVKKTRRSLIRRAIDSEIRIQELSSWDQWKESFYILLQHSIEKRYPLNLDIKMWKLTFEKYYNNGSGKKVVFGAFHENKMLGAIVITIICGRATLDIPGNPPNLKNDNYSSLLMWRAIEYSKQKRCQSFNLSGLPYLESNLHGIRIFKESFGGIEVPIEEYCSNSAFSLAFNSLRRPKVSTLFNKSFHLLGLENLFWKIKSTASVMPLKPED